MNFGRKSKQSDTFTVWFRENYFNILSETIYIILAKLVIDKITLNIPELAISKETIVTGVLRRSIQYQWKLKTKQSSSNVESSWFTTQPVSNTLLIYDGNISWSSIVRTHKIKCQFDVFQTPESVNKDMWKTGCYCISINQSTVNLKLVITTK